MAHAAMTDADPNQPAASQRPPNGDEPLSTKQPRELLMLFFAEMWERFSFYGMRALLTLYLVKQLFADLGEEGADHRGKGIYAAYGALVYATPFIGGILADRVLGYKKTVMLGAVLMAVGHFVMAIETEFFLYIALAFLIVGNGAFKPNISSMVGGLYPRRDDPRRDGGFTIFYMGINLGAFLAPLLCGYLGETYGWAYGFGLAGLGMVLGLVVFGRGKHHLGANGDPPHPERIARRVGPITVEWWIYAAVTASVALFALLIAHYEVMTYVLTPFAVGVVLVIFVFAIRSPKVARERLFVVLVLLFFSTLFWAFFEQAGSSITLFTDSHVDRNAFGFSIPASQFQAVNPAFILLFAIPFSMLWTKLAKIGKEPSIPVKFALGIAQLGLGFLVFAWGGSIASTTEITTVGSEGPIVVMAATVPLFILLVGYLLHTTGELCLSPIGLSMVTKLSPKAITAMVMGGWFLSSAMAHHLAGIIALLTSPPSESAAAGQIARKAGLIDGGAQMAESVLRSYDALANYLDVFRQLGYVALGTAVLCLLLSPLLTKWMHLDVKGDGMGTPPVETEPSTF